MCCRNNEHRSLTARILSRVAVAVLLISGFAVQARAALDLSNWTHRVKIEIPGYKGAATLDNFPMLVILNTNTPGFRYADIDDPEGDDLRFADTALTNFLNHEIEEWNTNGASYVWVQIPSLSPAPPAFWAIWGNPLATNPPSYSTNGATWDGTFKEVWHLDQTNGVEDLRDSTSSGHHGVNNGTTNAPGMISYGQGGGRIDVPNGETRPMPNTMSVWFKTTSDFYWLIDYNYSTHPYFILAVDGYYFPGKPTAYEGPGWAETAVLGDIIVNDGVWHQCVYTRSVACDGSQVFAQMYIDGVPVPSSFWGWGWPASCGNHSFLRLNSGAPVNSLIDEVRVQNVMRNDDWIQAEWASVVSNDTYLAWTDMVSNMPAVVLSPTNGWLRGNINWTTDVAATTFICWGTNDGDKIVTGWDNVDEIGPTVLGPFSNMTYFAPDTLYYFRCFASNSITEHWADPADFFVSSEVFVEATDSMGHETGPDPAEFRIFRNSSVTSVALTVPYSMGGTATEGADYSALSGVAYLDAGVTSIVVTVATIDDDVPQEMPETVLITLATGGNYPVAAPGSASAVIEDNDRLLNWRKCLYLQVFGYDRDSTLTGFPALVKFAPDDPTGFDYSDFASPYGYDLRFLDRTEREMLSYEVEEWNTGGTSYVWVKVPEVDKTGAGIWAIWSNPDMTDPPALSTNRSTWSENYQGVWHLQATSGTAAADSSPAMVDGATENMEDGDWTNGIVANGVDLDGVNERISVVSSEAASEVTHSLWVRPAAGATNHGLFAVTDNGSGGDRDLYTLGSNVTARLETTEEISSSNDVFTADEWHYVAHTFGPSITGQKLYVDGLPVATGIKTSSDFTSDTRFRIGYAPEAVNDYALGLLDEVRVSDVPRSDDWIWAVWINIMSNDVFWWYGDVHQCGGSVLVVR